MNQSIADRGRTLSFKSVLPFTALIITLLVIVPICSVLATGLPSFGVSVLVTNYESEPVNVRVQSVLTDDAMLIQPGESASYKLFAGDHGAEFDRLTQGIVTIAVTATGKEVVEYDFPGEDLIESKHASFKYADGEIAIDPFYGAGEP